MAWTQAEMLPAEVCLIKLGLGERSCSRGGLDKAWFWREGARVGEGRREAHQEAPSVMEPFSTQEPSLYDKSQNFKSISTTFSAFAVATHFTTITLSP